MKKKNSITSHFVQFRVLERRLVFIFVFLFFILDSIIFLSINHQQFILTQLIYKKKIEINLNNISND